MFATCPLRILGGMGRAAESAAAFQKARRESKRLLLHGYEAAAIAAEAKLQKDMSGR